MTHFRAFCTRRYSENYSEILVTILTQIAHVLELNGLMERRLRHTEYVYY